MAEVPTCRHDISLYDACELCGADEIQPNPRVVKAEAGKLSPAAQAALTAGLESARRGEIQPMGDFTQYVGEPVAPSELESAEDFVERQAADPGWVSALRDWGAAQYAAGKTARNGEAAAFVAAVKAAVVRSDLSAPKERDNISRNTLAEDIGFALARLEAAATAKVTEGREALLGIAADVYKCAVSWEQDARLIGNVRAGDIANLALWAMARMENEDLSSSPPPPWKRAPEQLPDSDVRVLIVNHEGDYLVAELEFTDDSEGNGAPYWSADGGDLALCNYPHWMPLPAQPLPSEPK